MWCGLPILATRGDEFGDMVGRETLGVMVEYGDSDSWRAAIRRMMTDAEYVDRCRANVASVRTRYTWSRVVEPLAEICRNASPSRDRVEARKHAKKIHLDILNKPSILMRLRDAYGRYGFVGTVNAVLRRAGFARGRTDR